MGSEFNFKTEGKTVVERWGKSIEGKTVVITGTSEGGLGAITAISLAAAHPAQLILLARSENKVRSAIQSIKQLSTETQTTFVPIELDYFNSVRNAAQRVREQAKKVDVLINNAGVMAIPWEKNQDGIEKTLAINHLGHFLLTKLLMPSILAAGPGSRIVNLTSAAYKMSPFDFDDWNFSNGETYNPFAAYGQSKTANILFTVGLAERYTKDGIYSFAVHPGYIPGTSLVTHLPQLELSEMDDVSRKRTGFPFAPSPPKSQEQGIATTLVATLSPELKNQNGAYLADCQVDETRQYATDRELVDRLWKLSEELVGEGF